jgi:hypothetical protein
LRLKCYFRWGRWWRCPRQWPWERHGLCPWCTWPIQWGV